MRKKYDFEFDNFYGKNVQAVLLNCRTKKSITSLRFMLLDMGDNANICVYLYMDTWYYGHKTESLLFKLMSSKG